MATVTIKWRGNPPCGKGNLPYVGESYFLYLDQTYFATDVSAAISATFVSEGPGGSGYERTYTFEFLHAAIPTGFAVIDSCHVKSVGCVDSCCAELQRQINDIEILSTNWGTQVVSSDSTLTGLGTVADPLGLAVLKFSHAHNPALLGDGAREEVVIPAIGAALGDYVIAAYTIDTQGVDFKGRVSSAGNVTVTIQNETGGAIDLAAATINVSVLQA